MGKRSHQPMSKSMFWSYTVSGKRTASTITRSSSSTRPTWIISASEASKWAARGTSVRISVEQSLLVAVSTITPRSARLAGTAMGCFERTGTHSKGRSLTWTWLTKRSWIRICTPCKTKNLSRKRGIASSLNIPCPYPSSISSSRTTFRACIRVIDRQCKEASRSLSSESQSFWREVRWINLAVGMLVPD